MTGTAVGRAVELVVGPVAHGGHMVARLPEGQVVFVRHALPGEVVRAVITEERSGYLRADAVEVIEPGPDRVPPPCPYAGPGRCGGCDFQHVSGPAQRELKAAVVREQLTRLGRLSPDEVERLGVRVEPLPGGLLGWRSRVRYAVDPDGRLGFHRYRSADVVPIDRCVIAHPAIQALDLTARSWPPAAGAGGVAEPVAAVEVVASSTADVTALARRGADDRSPGRAGRAERLSGPRFVRELAYGRVWSLPPEAFWQVHPAAADTLVATVLDQLAPAPGEWAWDLYGGAGLFAAAVAEEVGEAGRVWLVESDRRAVAAARHSLADLPQVRVVAADVASALADPRWRRVDLVVLDPPRAGVGQAVIEAVLARRPRAVAYVSCDPAAFARDVKTFRDAGWRLAELRAFDAFPMTHHVETAALLVPPS